MKALVDTSVWSLALRKKTRNPGEEKVVRELIELIREMRVAIIGPIRQELLSGISDGKKYENLRGKLAAFEDEPLQMEHYELAAALSNECRRKGIQGSHTDFLICAISRSNNYPIFTLDQDFKHYEPNLKIKLHTVRKDIF